MKLAFTKMNGLGNDYIFINAINNSALVDIVIPYISLLSDRNFGIGGDGVIFITESRDADCRMRMFNSDGREGAMCGNGIRELAKLVWDKNIIQKNPLRVETKNGILSLELSLNKNNQMSSVKVQMGMMNFDPKIIPFNTMNSKIEKGIHILDYLFQEKIYRFYVGSIGSKHAVCFLEEDVTTFDFCTLGRMIEQNTSLFPDGVNVEFVNIISDDYCVMRVWERGSGHTLACGTGATFVAGLGMELGYFSSKDVVEVQLERGSLYISKHIDGEMIMDGIATLVFDGEINLNQFNV